MNIHLPDGSSREVPQGATIAEVAASIGPRLAKDAIAGKIDGKVVDVYVPVPRGRDRRDRDRRSPSEGLDVIRHSTAHLMANAVQELFPGTQVTIGPVIENGFFYDFATDRPFTDEDLARIEEKMAEIAKRDHPDPPRGVGPRRGDRPIRVDRREVQGRDHSGHPAGMRSSPIYRQGDWKDLCRGPHVPSTGKLGVFKLLSVAGAYWRGDERNAMLQRIYGTAWADKKDLEAHLKRLEEARARDHRKLGEELELFMFSQFAPAMPIFLPKGRGHLQRADRLRPRVLPARRVRRGRHSAHLGHRDLPHLGALRELQGRDVLLGSRREGVRREADELPRPHPDLSRRPATPIATCRSGWPTSRDSTATSGRA